MPLAQTNTVDTSHCPTSNSSADHPDDLPETCPAESSCGHPSPEFPIDDSKSIGLFLKTAGDLERVGDHAVNIAERAEKLYSEDEHFSDEAMREIKIMNDLTRNILEELNVLNRDELHNIVEKVDVIEDSIDITTHEFSLNQLRRLRDKKCTPEHSALYTETLIDFERIGDHGLNIAVAFDEIKDDLTEMA